MADSCKTLGICELTHQVEISFVAKDSVICLDLYLVPVSYDLVTLSSSNIAHLGYFEHISGDRVAIFGAGNPIGVLYLANSVPYIAR